MESLIKQLWDGTVCVSKDFYSREKYELRCAKLHAFTSRLEKTLSDDQRLALQQLLHCCDELERSAVEEAFALGYKTGVRAVVETLAKSK